MFFSWLDYSIRRSVFSFQYVCKNVPIENRRPELTFEHHLLVAPFEPDVQKAMLDRAVEDGMTASDLDLFIEEWMDFEGKEVKR